MVAGVAGVFRAPAGIAVRLARSRELVQVHHRLVAASLALDPLPCRPPAITVAVIVSFIPSISFLFSQELSHPFHLSFIDWNWKKLNIDRLEEVIIWLLQVMPCFIYMYTMHGTALFWFGAGRSRRKYIRGGAGSKILGAGQQSNPTGAGHHLVHLPIRNYWSSEIIFQIWPLALIMSSRFNFLDKYLSTIASDFCFIFFSLVPDYWPYLKA